MSALGSIIALGAALAFAVVAALLVWGGYLTLRDELRRSFIVNPPAPAARAFNVLLFVGPLLGAALLSLLAAGKIALVALGISG